MRPLQKITRQVRLNSQPKPLYLFINYYQDSNPARSGELQRSLSKNLDNPHLSRIFLIHTPDESPPTGEKLIPVRVETRPTYNDLFEIIRQNTSPGQISMVANSDIYFDETLALIACYPLGEKCLAIGRWDETPEGINLFERADAQDVWVFEGLIKPVKGDFYLGKPGCDNRIAHELVEAGYEVINPARSVRCIHVHHTGIRRYDQSQKILPPYRKILPEEWIIESNDS